MMILNYLVNIVRNMSYCKIAHVTVCKLEFIDIKEMTAVMTAVMVA